MSVSVNINDLPHDVAIKIPVGDSYRALYTLQRDTGTTAAVDLTGVTWSLIISGQRSGTALLTKTTTAAWTASGIYVDSAAAGQFTVYVLAADCTTIGTLQRGYYEVVATFPADHAAFPSMEKTLLAGSVTIAADTTA